MVRQQDAKIAQVVTCGASDDCVAEALKEVVGVVAVLEIRKVEASGARA